VLGPAGAPEAAWPIHFLDKDAQSSSRKTGELPGCALLWKVACKHQIAMKGIGVTSDCRVKPKSKLGG
jgi:hypothetical protein